ncbi:CPBP family intramembrane glutamic endopeptidase [Nonomuraea spiralis]|uniref:CPBP family intramembrane glutamic endopeptidase n=1 Tax=Nonomuraea spiralis TaxID=46182 RepID=A0ABV5I6U5_9ACTN|nr:CPBP family intramembrane glutamic endopeptidase [Nonomuraea spiralis]GGS66957.1 CAAX amino protease [Nonomuraea spiralis]
MIKRYPLLAFLAMAYLGSWIGWSPWWLSQSGVGLLPYELSLPAIAGVNQLGLFAGPFAAAIVVTRVVEGPSGWRRLLRWRAHPGWYVLALAVIPFAVAVGYTVQIGAAAAVTYVVYLIGGPVQEEPGWRGVALPLLQRRLHPLAAASVLGVIHCFWHVPLFLTREWDTARSDAGQLVAYLVLTVALSIVLAWLVNGSQGSMAVAILGHNGVNWALFLAGTTVTSTWPAALGLAALAVVAVTVTRGRLGVPR